MGLSDAQMHERMVKGWRAGQPETVCGNGSTLYNTRNIRRWLPTLIERLDIKVLADAGAGDLYWISRCNWERPLLYRPYDLIPRAPGVTQIDITKTSLPLCDAILCRMVLNHLGDDPQRICDALALFRASAKYLIATQFTPEDKPLPHRSVQFERLDLRGAPFYLGAPIDAVQDGSESWCSLALWKL